MAKSPIVKARFEPDIMREYNKLKARLGHSDVYGGDSKALKDAVILANKHLDLKARLNELFSGF